MNGAGSFFKANGLDHLAQNHLTPRLPLQKTRDQRFLERGRRTDSLFFDILLPLDKIAFLSILERRLASPTEVGGEVVFQRNSEKTTGAPL